MSVDGMHRKLPKSAAVAAQLPPKELWPTLDWLNGAFLEYPERLNCAAELLDKTVADGRADNVLFWGEDGSLTYGAFQELVNRLAHVLVEDHGVAPGSRVLLHGPNTPMLAAAWFAVLKAGGICVATMPLLRAHELAQVVQKVHVELALCHSEWSDELRKTQERTGWPRRFVHIDGDMAPTGELAVAAANKPASFEAHDSSADDIALIAFTSGTTGQAKATAHFHRDVLAVCDAFPRSILGATASDRFCGTPPLAFTYGLGGLLIFPMRLGASIALLAERPTPEGVLKTIQGARATVCFASPTTYRAMVQYLPNYDIGSLRCCVSAGETLPAAVFEHWQDQTGISIIDGIGSTEMLHIFISATATEMRAGATGKPIPGYEAKVVGPDGQTLPRNSVGLLAVRGPTGCRYLDDEARQREYVRDGWNYTGDCYLVDDDGYFHYRGRADDMIISSGYNIAGIEVEDALLRHPDVLECAVIGVPDPARGQIVKAYVVLRASAASDGDAVCKLQDFVKSEIAPYKYPRAVEFVQTLPRTLTGKMQRFKLRQDAAAQVAAST